MHKISKKLKLEYSPKTELGKKLLALRKAYIKKGGKLLNKEELEKEINLRRGGIKFEETDLS